MLIQNNVDNLKDGLADDDDDDANLKADLKKQKDEVVSYHLKVVQQKLDMSKKNLADLYPEEQYVLTNPDIQNGNGNQSYSKMGLVPSDKRQYISPFRPNLKMYFPQKDLPVQLGDPTKIQFVRFQDVQETSEEIRQRNNKDFFTMPPVDRVYPSCNEKYGTVFRSYTELTREFMICASLCHEIMVETKKEDDGTIIKSYQGSSPDEIAICLGARSCGYEFLGNSLGISRVDVLG